MKARLLCLIAVSAMLLASFVGAARVSHGEPGRRELECSALASSIRPLGTDGRAQSVRPLLFLPDGFYAALAEYGMEGGDDATEDDSLCFVSYDGRLRRLERYLPEQPGEGRGAQRLLLCMAPFGDGFALIEQMNEYWWDDPKEKTGYRYTTRNFFKLIDAEGTASVTRELDVPGSFFDPEYLYMAPDGGFTAVGEYAIWVFDASGGLTEMTEGGVKELAPGASEHPGAQLFPVRGGGEAAMLYIYGAELCAIGDADEKETLVADIGALGVEPQCVRGADMLADGTIVCVYEESGSGRPPCSVLLLRPK